MYLISNIFINTFSILMLSIVLVYSKKYGETESTQNKIYMMNLGITSLLLIFDIFSRLDGHANKIFPLLNQIGNFLVFFTTPILPSLWVLYIYNFIYKPKKQKKCLLITLSVVNAINFIMVILTQWYGWFYYIDAENVYHRGPLYVVALFFTLFLLNLATILVAKNRNKIEHKHYFALLLFAIPPILCIILQLVFYGFSFIYNGIALSALILFLYIQNQDIFTDYLTGVANRKKLELYLKKMISNSTPNRTFSAIMMDLDNFKIINDTLGHKAGDEALQIAARLMRSCIGKQDFIARYGGDEFCIVLDTSDISKLKDVVNRLKSIINEYNESGNQPFKLGLSMGYAIYEYGMTADEFQNIIDKLMYEHKHSATSYIQKAWNGDNA